MVRLLLGAGAAAGCAPRIHLTVLDAADVAVPADVRAIAVTADPGLGPVADGLRARLGESPRFDVVDASSHPDAVITVSGLSTASALREDGVGPAGSDGDDPRPRVEVTRLERVSLTWTFADRDGTVIDTLPEVAVVDRFTAAGSTADQARGELVSEPDAVRELLTSAGAAYARRIASFRDDVVRSLWTGGDPALRRGARDARWAGDWRSARAIWSELAAESASDEVRARAWYNLAVVDEVDGSYRRALDDLDRAAAIVGDPPRITRYRRALARAWAERRPLVHIPPPLPAPEAPLPGPGEVR